MNKITTWMCALGFLLVTPCAFSITFNILVGPDRPPYIVEEAASGYELELIRQAIQQTGNQVRFVHMPKNRITKALLSGRYDAALIAKTAANQQQYLWSGGISCHPNVLVSRQTPVELPFNVEQLRPMKIYAFQGASQLLGEQIAPLVESTLRYQEVTDQENQVRALFQHKVDAILLDSRVFQYYLQQLAITQPYTMKKLDDCLCYSLASHSADFTERLNQALQSLDSNGLSSRLQQSYFNSTEQEQCKV